MAKKADSPRGKFQEAVFLAVYRSATQKRRRSMAMLFLFAKHFLHGFMLTWPFFLLLAAGFMFSSNIPFYLLAIFLFPGLAAWLIIYGRGAKKDYTRLVSGQILEKGFLRKLI